MSTAQSSTSERIAVQVSPDALAASLQVIRRPHDESPVTADEVLAALAEARIALDDTVKARVAEFLDLTESEDGLAEPFVVATGRPAEEGKDEEFVWDEKFDRHATDWQDDAPVNYYERGSVTVVDEDTILGTVTALVPAKDGIDVRGEAIKPCSVPERLELCDTVRRAEDNPSQIVSNVPGKIVLCGAKLRIEEVLRIEGDVDFSTGNIKSPAAVHVTGAVPDRFEVRSAKSITVGTVIEAAHIEAAGEVTARGGIVGRNAGKVRAGGRIVAKFCSEADLFAEGDVLIGNQLLNSRVHARGKLVAEHSAVLGGHIYAAGGADVGVLGCDSCIPTHVFVGTRPDVLVACAAMEERLRPAREAVERVREKVQPLLYDLKRLTPWQREQTTKLAHEAEEAATRIAREEDRCRRMLEAAGGGKKPQVWIAKMIYPRVTIYLGNRSIMFDELVKGPVTIEEQQIDDATEAVAVSQLSGAVKILTSQQLPLDRLLQLFEPLSEPDRTAVDGE
jgi:uncharacterized protein (DUF342 family)